MKLKRYWDEDESKQVEEEMKLDEALFATQDILWEALRLRTECEKLQNSLGKHIICLDERIARIRNLIEL